MNMRRQGVCMCRGQGRGAADTTVSYVWNVYGIMECAWIMVQRTSWSWCSYLTVAVVGTTGPGEG